LSRFSTRNDSGKIIGRVGSGWIKNVNNIKKFIMITVKIVEDERIFAEALEEKLQSSGIVSVTGRYYSCAECRAAITGPHAVPDVMLMDIDLKDGKGTELSVELMRKYPQLKIILLTDHDNYTLILREISIGIHGYILKSARLKVILEGIKAVTARNFKDVYLCEEAARVIRGKEAPKKMPFIALPILHCIAAGFNDRQAVAKVFRSRHTITDIVKQLMEDYGVSNRTALVVKAIEEQLITFPQVDELREELAKIVIQEEIEKNRRKAQEQGSGGSKGSK